MSSGEMVYLEEMSGLLYKNMDITMFLHSWFLVNRQVITFYILDDVFLIIDKKILIFAQITRVYKGKDYVETEFIVSSWVHCQ